MKSDNSNAVKAAWVWVVVWVVLVVIATSMISFRFWDCLSTSESGSSTIRNIVLTAAAVIALPLAIWRSIVADRQADTARQGLLNERYQKGAEMLGNSVLSVRLGGIYALQHVAKEHPDQYHIRIMQLLCAFVRSPTMDRDGKADETPLTDNPQWHNIRIWQDRQMSALIVGEDIQAIMEAIGGRGKEYIALEQKKDFKLDFGSANLNGLMLKDIDLSYADFTNAILSNTLFVDADLSFAKCLRGNFSNVQFLQVNLCHANFWFVNLSNANLKSVNFSEAQIMESKLYGSDLRAADMSKTFLIRTDLSNTKLGAAKLFGAHLNDTNLSGAELYDFESESKQPVKGLTQAQLDMACADPNNPPKLDGFVLDAETGKPLVWRGKPFEQNG